MLNRRVEAVFPYLFRLQLFPFDQQRLEIAWRINCANEGAIPVELSISKDCVRGLIGQDTFAARHTWTIGAELKLDVGTTGPTAARRFPALRISMPVRRLPFFYVMKVVVPTIIFSRTASLRR